MYRKNVAGQYLFFGMVTTAGAADTGATVTVAVCIDNAAQAAGAGTVTHMGGGQYKYAMTQAETNGNDLSFYFTATGDVPVEKTVVTTAADPTDSVRFGLTALPNAAAQAAGGLYTQGSGAGQINQSANGQIDVNLARILNTASVGAAGSVGIDWGQVANKTTANALTGTTISTAQTITSVSGSVGSVTGAVGSVTGNVGGNVVGSVGSVTGAVGSVTGNVGGSVASVTGAVGSVTGNVGGNVVGSVGSVTGAVGSVTGNVGGNVTGSVGSISGVTFPGNFSLLGIDANGRVKALVDVQKNTALSNFMFLMTDSTTHAPLTGLVNASFSIKHESLDGAAPAALSGTITEVGAANLPGFYKISFTAAELNANVIALEFVATGSAPTALTIRTSA